MRCASFTRKEMQASRFLRTVSKAFHSASRENAMGIGAGAGADEEAMLHVAQVV